ncbi:MAG: DUF998 domain-containing protein [Candidatus Bathyarchaeia archaeon]|nr:DUF998 domain-containing protein [Candidatus Bathyarchaeota archaeon]
MLSPVLAFVLIGLAISGASWFSWSENALSDLGVHDESALLFNSGLILSGILTVIFAFGVIRFYGAKTVGRSGAFFLLLAGIFLAAIGVFPETAPNNIHYIVSVAFFAALPLSLFIQTAALISSTESRNFGVFTLVMGIIALSSWAIWAALKPYRGVAIPELVSAIAAALWSISMGVKLIHQAEPR